jgi:hypothetical protein
MPSPPDADPRIAAAVALIGRTGADNFEIRFCDGHDDDVGKPPVIWLAIAHWPAMELESSEGTRDHRPEHFEAAGGLTPWLAVFRLCETTMDGGTCRHCGRPTLVDDKPADAMLRQFESAADVCAYRYDPELDTFRRACEGVA